MASGWAQFRLQLSPAHRAMLDDLVQKLVALSKRRPMDPPAEHWWRWIHQANQSLTQEQCKALASYAMATCDGSVRPAGNMGEMSQMDMMRLQQLMQKQSQMMQMMSNLMKSQHDVAKSIINNMR